jgi:uncharacterized membrane-anchored protein YhcB (DUF1043 family)
MMFNQIHNHLSFLVQAAAETPQTLDPSHLLSQIANYIYQMQVTVAILAVVVGLITIVVGALGLVMSRNAERAQRAAQEEIKQFHAESKQEIALHHVNNRNELADRHRSFAEQMDLLRESAKVNIDVGLSNMREEFTTLLEKKVEHIERMFSSDIIIKLENAESMHAFNLKKIEDIAVTFQNECMSKIDGHVTFDFERYNTFRYLLLQLVSGGRGDAHAALGRMQAKYAQEIGESTASGLKSLIVGLRDAGRFSRSDLRILAGEVIKILDSRFFFTEGEQV